MPGRIEAEPSIGVAAVLVASLAVAIAFVAGCDGGAGGGAREDQAPSSSITPDSAFREIFDHRLPGMDAGLSDAHRVDTTFTQGHTTMVATAWFANGSPLAMELESQSAGVTLVDTRFYYDDRGKLLARTETAYPNRPREPSSAHHIVARTLYGPGGQVRWGEIAVDGRPVTSRSAVESSPAYEPSSVEPEVLKLMTRLAAMTPHGFRRGA